MIKGIIQIKRTVSGPDSMSVSLQFCVVSYLSYPLPVVEINPKFIKLHDEGLKIFLCCSMFYGLSYTFGSALAKIRSHIYMHPIRGMCQQLSTFSTNTFISIYEIVGFQYPIPLKKNIIFDS